ncbi:DUF1573 domain-containing protein [candidate division KSB1 bacterium]|nr:DUF1573 domain-containing protein [candidate division KSB1 bacterium]
MAGTFPKLLKWNYCLLTAGILLCCLSNCSDNQKQISSEKNEAINSKVVGSNDSKEKPLLKIAGPTHIDLGTVMEGSEPHVVFMLLNTGTAAARVAVDDLSKGGCTAVSLIPTLAPGDSSILEFIFETLGYGGRTETRRIQINYNNPENSPLEFSVSATVTKPEPYQALTGELWYGYYLLIDVRSPKEFAREHLVGSINVPFDELMEWTASLPQYILIYLISQDGTQSDQAAIMLREKGYSECVSLVGGLDEWKNKYISKQLLIAGNR